MTQSYNINLPIRRCEPLRCEHNLKPMLKESSKMAEGGGTDKLL